MFILRKHRNFEWISVAVLTIATLMIFIRSYFSFCQSDESNYLAMVYRFVQGDAPIVDEWHPTQLYAILLMPAFRLFQIITGSTDGIYLYFRFLGNCLSAGTAWYLYVSTRKMYGWGAALLSSILVISYSRGNIGGLSYYNMFSSGILLMSLFLWKYLRSFRCQYGFLAGVFGGMVVMCMPYAIVLMVIILAYLLLQRATCSVSCVVGGTAIGVPVLAYIFLSVDNNASLVSNLWNITHDPEHTESAVQQIVKSVINIYEYMPRAVWMVVIIILIELLLAVRVNIIRHKRNTITREQSEFMFVWAVFLSSFALIYSVYRYAVHILYLSTIPVLIFLCFLPILCGIVVFRSCDHLCGLLIVIGLASSLCFAAGSNVLVDALSTGLLSASIGIILWTCQYYRICSIQNDWIRKIAICTVYFSLGITCLAALFQRWNYVYRDAYYISQMDTRFENGPAAGLYSTSEHVQQYNSVLLMIDDLKVKYPKAKVFFTAMLPWAYIASNYECGAPTTWRTLVSSKRLKDYYCLHEEKIPDIVIILDENIGENIADFEPNINDRSGWLWNYLSMNKYKEVRYGVAQVFISPEL